MLIDQSARNSIAGPARRYREHRSALHRHRVFLELPLAHDAARRRDRDAGHVVAYNYTTDWVKAAKVQKWSAAFRKVQMAAIRSGKKDRIAALKPHQERLTRLSGEVSIAQFKGMAITYFLLILIYTWVGLVILNANAVQQPFYRLGGHRKIHVDVRIVAATNQDLEAAVKDGRFRQDLFHRLGQIQLRVPPLRERPEDIVALAEHSTPESPSQEFFLTGDLRSSLACLARQHSRTP